MSIFSENTNVSFLVLLMAMGACAFTLFRISRRAAASRNASRGSSPLGMPRATRRDHGHNLDAPREFQGWEVEMHELSRRLKGELDTKLGLLQHLVAAADAAATRLERAIERAEQVEAVGPHNSLRSQTGTNLPPAPRDSIPSASGGPHRAMQSDERYSEIYALAEAGLDPASIARQVGSTTGEVQLILGLRKRS